MVERIPGRYAQHQVILLSAAGSEHAPRRPTTRGAAAWRSAATSARTAHAFRPANPAHAGRHAVRIVHAGFTLVAECPGAGGAQVQGHLTWSASRVPPDRGRARGRPQVEA